VVLSVANLSTIPNAYYRLLEDLKEKTKGNYRGRLASLGISALS
jgi:hypothetical protein